MKKLTSIFLCAAALLAVFLIPIEKGPYDDGGTVEYQALLYRYIRWNHIMPAESDIFLYQGTEWRFFPNNFGPLGEPNIE